MAAREPRSLTPEKRLRFEIQRPLGYQPGASISNHFLFDNRCHTDHHSPPTTTPDEPMTAFVILFAWCFAFYAMADQDPFHIKSN